MNQRPQYDIAYSMLGLDEPYARRLLTELKKRVPGEQYIYSRKTEDADPDVDLLRTFGRIFSEDSRLVVLLYRPGWGGTRFTSVEQEAIEARRHELGIRSIFVVAMQPPHIPDWYPDHEFWADADVYSVPQISAMIEFALAQQQATAAPEPPTQQEARVHEPEPPADLLEQHPEEDGSVRVIIEAEKLFAALAEEAAEFTRAGQSKPACELTATACTVTYNQTALRLKVDRSESIPCVYAVLTAWVNISDSARQSLPFGEWRLVQVQDEHDQRLWKLDEDLLTPRQLARTLMERLVELAHEDRADPRIAQRSIRPPADIATLRN
jgi:hypothetical protein